MVAAPGRRVGVVARRFRRPTAAQLAAMLLMSPLLVLERVLTSSRHWRAVWAFDGLILAIAAVQHFRSRSERRRKQLPPEAGE
jgi:hypothetical protein